MSEERTTPEARAPEAKIVPARRWSWLWLLPLGVGVLLVVLGVQASAERPERVMIKFEEGAGLRPGDPVTCRGVQIGVVREVRLTSDVRFVIVAVDLSPEASGVAVDQTQFWVVRPEVSLRGVSGLDALFGPRSIACEPGPPGSRRRTSFDGLERAPPLPAPTDGSLLLTLRAPRRGSLGPGTPVTYRDMRVGQVVDAALSRDAVTVELQITVEPEHARLVRANSRFYNVSGITADWGIFKGLDVRADSLETLVAGGVGFATPDRPGPPVESGHIFELAPGPDDLWLRWSPSIPPAGE